MIFTIFPGLPATRRPRPLADTARAVSRKRNQVDTKVLNGILSTSTMKGKPENGMEKNWLTFLSAAVLLVFNLTEIETQEAPGIPRVGVLVPESSRAESQAIKGLRDGLKELGHIEGKGIVVIVRDAKGNRAALKDHAEELVRQNVNFIFTTGTRATQTAKTATDRIPVLFNHPGDPVALGFVKSMDHPERNVTGVAGLSLQTTEKRLELLREIMPQVRRVLIPYDANNQFSRENFSFAKRAAEKLGLEVADYPVKAAEELKKTISNIQKRDGDALFHIPDDLVEAEINFIFQAARQKGLATMSYEELWVIKGALVGYGPNYYQMGRQVARLADRILKGQKPQGLPVERANKFDLVINYRTANAISLSIPRDVLKRADRVIR